LTELARPQIVSCCSCTRLLSQCSALAQFIAEYQQKSARLVIKKIRLSPNSGGA
jgi:hypothetical protein